jgi:hypothetical protein
MLIQIVHCCTCCCSVHATHGAYAICLSGGYKDDSDDGHTFWYTGVGGQGSGTQKRMVSATEHASATAASVAVAAAAAVAGRLKGSTRA